MIPFAAGCVKDIGVGIGKVRELVRRKGRPGAGRGEGRFWCGAGAERTTDQICACGGALLMAGSGADGGVISGFAK